MGIGVDVPDSCRTFWLDNGETLVAPWSGAVKHNAGMVAGNRYCRRLPFTSLDRFQGATHGGGGVLDQGEDAAPA